MKFRGSKLLAAGGAAALILGAGSALADVKAGVDRWMGGDFKGAVAEWRPLADKGDADAQFNLGQAYKMGRGVPADLAQAQAWYQKAAAKGHQQAQVNVGLLLYNSGKRREALPWIRKGVELGDPRAQYILGTEMFNGDLVTKDWPRAYALMLLAADRGLAPAADNIKAMDSHIPAAERQKGVALSRTLRGASPAEPVSPILRPAPNSNVAITTAPRPPVRAGTVQPARPAASPLATGGGWRVQLGAFGNAANAQRAWGTLKAKAGTLAALQPKYVQAGAVVRLQAGPFPNRAAADRACAAAKAAGSACFPVAP